MKLDLGTRSLIATGDGSLSVTIPSAFVRALALKKGDRLRVSIIGRGRLLMEIARCEVSSG